MEFLQEYSLLWLTGLVVALVVTGIVAGVLAGLLGVGGGIVVVPVLYHLFTLLGVEEAVRMHLAVGTSLATIIPTSLRSARSHYLKGGLRPDLLKKLLPGVILGVVIGILLSGLFSGPVLAAIFGIVALLVAINMAFNPHLDLGNQLPGVPGTLGLGSFIGTISTLMGIGGGTMSVPLLSAYRVAMHQAVGTGAAIGVVISIPGALGFVISGWDVADRLPGSLGYVNLLGFAIIVPATLLSAPWGVNLAHRLNANRLKQAFALFLAITAVRMLYGLIA